MSKILQIDKELIPYEFEIVLSQKTYTFGIKYNSKKDMFTVDLYKDDVALVLGEKIVLGGVLFEAISHDSKGNRYKYFFDEILFPYDFSETQTRITYDNFCDWINLVSILARICDSVYIWIGDRT